MSFDLTEKEKESLEKNRAFVNLLEQSREKARKELKKEKTKQRKRK